MKIKSNFIALTKQSDQLPTNINVENIAVIENAANGGTSIIMMGNAVGRIVVESPDVVMSKIHHFCSDRE